jgi:hypothetical protein
LRLRQFSSKQEEISLDCPDNHRHFRAARWKTRYEKIGYWISEDEWNRLLEEHPEIADWAKEAEEGD